MASVTHKEYQFPRKAEVRILPTTAHEVSCVLIYSIESPSGDVENVCLGQINDNVEDLSPVLVRLGTKVSEAGHTSNIGFRVLLQQDAREGRVTGQLEDDYHLVSCTFIPSGNSLTRRILSDQEMAQLEGKFKSIRGTTLGTFGTSELYAMEFKSVRMGKTFLISRHGGELHSNPSILHTSKQVQSIAYAKRVLIFFRADHVLCAHLNSVIENNCIGQAAPSWKDSLPEDAVPTWPLDIQRRMVVGSTEPFNVLNTALRHNVIYDGEGTDPKERPQARTFADCLRSTYPSAKSEPSGKVFPLMLNVTDGVCLDLPFGLSMYNRKNMFVGVMALYQLLRTSILPSTIGIVTFYPSQAETYRNALQQLHKQSPMLGYNQVAVDTLEGWVGKDIGIAIVDFVRTSNASGNLGYLSQSRRLKLALTFHRDGFIIVADRKCTTNARGEIISTKLEKIFEWFSNNGRMVDVSIPSADGILVQREASGRPSDTQSGPDPHSKARNHAFSPAVWAHLAASRLYVGPPGFEDLKILTGLDETGRAPSFAGAPIGVKNLPKDVERVKTSFERQLELLERERLKRERLEREIAATSKTVSKPQASSRPEAQDSFARQNIIMKGRGKFLYHDDKLPQAPFGGQTSHGSELSGDAKEVMIPVVSNSKLSGAPEPQIAGLPIAPISSALTHDRSEKPSGNTAAVDQAGRWKSATTAADLSSPPRQRKSSKECSGAIASVMSQTSPKILVGDSATERQTLRSRLENVNLEPAAEGRPSSSNENTAPAVKQYVKANPGSPLSTSVEKVQLNSKGTPVPDSFLTPTPFGNGLSMRDTNLQQPLLVKESFKAEFREKYEKIRKLFKTMDRPPGPHPKEDYLFRILADQFEDQDAQAFNKTFNELLGMVGPALIG